MKKALFLFILTAITYDASAQIYQVVREKIHDTFKGATPVFVSITSVYYKPVPVFSNTRPGREQKYRHEHTFDKAGILTSTLIYNNDELTDKQVNEIDSSRRLVMGSIRNHYSSLPNLTDTITNMYDQNGYIIKQVSNTGDAAVVVEYTNDDNGYPIATRTSDAKGNIQTTETAVYFHAKNYLIVTAKDMDGRLLSKDTSKINYKKPYGTYRAKEKYNEQGDCISYRAKNRDGSFTEKEAEYEYDVHGNWISMKWYEVVKTGSGSKNRKLDAVYTRDIMYQKN